MTVSKFFHSIHPWSLPEDKDDTECRCPNPKCLWEGYWDDCELKVIPMTRQDPEERYSLCPMCGEDVEGVE